MPVLSIVVRMLKFIILFYASNNVFARDPKRTRPFVIRSVILNLGIANML